MYPVPDYAYFGIHIKEQIEALKKYKLINSEVYFINGREKKNNYLKSIFKIRKKISEKQYDLVHIHYGVSGLFLLFFKPNIPVVITLHSGELYRKKGLFSHLVQKKLTLSILKRSDKIIVLNDDTAASLEKYKGKIIKLPCGLDLQVFKKMSTNKNTDSILIGFPGNKARKEKNFKLFSEIINLLRKTNTIEIAEFHQLTRNEVVEKLNQIDLLLMTSTVEGSPQIIKEAMACNKPIVSTNVGDVKDLLKGVKNSFLIDSYDPEVFIEPLRQIINLPQDQRTSNGREKLAKLELDSIAVSEKLYSIYKELICSSLV
jgi:glycosyltransferase involved in cell wall biosynthesis